MAAGFGEQAYICGVETNPSTGGNPVAKEVLDKGGFVEGKVGGRGVGVFETDLTLACTGRPGYWAVGDNAGVPDPTRYAMMGKP